jgi:HEAT repeat protein
MPFYTFHPAMTKTISLQSFLSGGDRRSIAKSHRALALVRSNPALVAQLAELAQDSDWLVSMRAMDLLEKLAHEHPEWVEPFKALFIGPLADSDKWEVRLQVVRALPLFAWSPEEKRRAIEILLRDAEHPHTFVRAWAVDSLATFAETDRELVPKLRRFLRKLEASGSKALATRARHIRSRLKSRGDSRSK